MTQWTPAPALHDEHERMRRLARLGVGEGQHHDALDHITSLVSSLLDVPMALVSLVEAERQFFLSRHGLDATSTGRSEAFCAHCVSTQAALRVPDAHADARFAGNPLVVGAPHVRAYLGVPLFAAPAQSAIGTLCAIDQKPRVWTRTQEEQLFRLGALAEHYIDDVTTRRAWEDSPLATVVLDAEGRCARANPALARFLGREASSLLDRPLTTFVLPSDRSVLQAMISHAVQQRQMPTRRELRFERLNGEIVHGGVSIGPMSSVDEQVVCIIRDISLERRLSAKSGVVADVRRELTAPLVRAREIAHVAAALQQPSASPQLVEMVAQLDELDAILDARIGDIAARARAEADLQASEQRLRTVLEHVIGPLLVLDGDGRIVDANRPAVDAFGWPYDQLIGSSMRLIQPTFSAEHCRRWFDASVGDGATAGRLQSEDALFVRRDDSEVHVELRMMMMDWNGPGRLVLLARDVTEAHVRHESLTRERDDLEERWRSGTQMLTAQQRMEAALKDSLEEKETLLKEIHHRVKNNLQMVSSLLTLQMDQMPDAQSRGLLVETVRRVRSMALIHQHLYGAASLERIDLGAYTRNLSDSLRHALAPTARILVQASTVEVGVERAAPVCLILNELLTNAFKYGTRPRTTDTTQSQEGAPVSVDDSDVLVEVHELNKRVIVRVRDRGPGLPDDFDMKQGNSLGLQLVTTLARQLRGRISARSEDGAVFELDFPLQA